MSGAYGSITIRHPAQMAMPTLFAILCVLCVQPLCVAMQARDDAEQIAKNTSSGPTPPAAKSDNGLTEYEPVTEIDGIAIRRIYFYSDQAPKLLTPGFWPVSIEELEDALQQRIIEPEKIESRPYLASTVYVARYQRGALISNASTFDITYGDDKPAVLELGAVNLALESQSSGTNRRLVTGGDGILRAIVDQDSRLRFAWSRRGLQMPEGRLDFDLQIPACGRTRFIVGMPKGTKLEARDGVMAALPSPPPEVQTTYGETSLIWYSIEAGGLSRIRLSVLDQTQVRPSDSKFVLRRLDADCTLGLRGLDWSASAVVDVPNGGDLPVLNVSGGGRITDVRVNGTRVSWQEATLLAASDNMLSALEDTSDANAIENLTSSATSTQQSSNDPAANPPQPYKNNDTSSSKLSSRLPQLTAITIIDEQSERTNVDDAVGQTDGTRGERAANEPTKVIEIFGTISADEMATDDLLDPPNAMPFTVDLPWLTFPQARTSFSFSQSEINLTVQGGLRLADIGTSVDWQSEDITSANQPPTVELPTQTRRYQFRGIPNTLPPPLRCTATKIVGQSTAAFRVAVVDKGLRANWEAAIDMQAEGPQPLEFEVQNGWQVDSVSIRSSGRVVDLRDEESSKFTLWPEPGDVVDGVLRLQITGSRALTESENLETIPKSWFIRNPQAILKCFAAVVPPPEYEWVPGTALEGKILDDADLPKLAAEMLGPIVGETLVFLANNGETPELHLAQPPAAFNSEMYLYLSLDGNQLVERLRINFRVPAGRVPSVQVQLGMGILGNMEARPPMRWSVLKQETAGALSSQFPKSSSLSGSGTDDLEAKLISSGETTVSGQPPGMNEVWELIPVGGIRDGLSLYGERRYEIVPSRSPSQTENGSPPAFDRFHAADRLELSFPLPSLPVTPSPQGSSHRASVTIGTNIDLLDTMGEVLRVPRTSSGSERPVSSPSRLDVSTKRDSVHDATWTLRYDPSEVAGITISPQLDRDESSVVWEQHLDILAGTAGDEICASFRVEGESALTIRFDDDMLVTRIDGRELSAENSSPGTLTVAPEPNGNSVKIYFWRPQVELNPLRLIVPPELAVQGVVMHSTVNLWPAVDTLALVPGQFATPPDWMSGEARGTMTHFRSDRTIWLVPNGLGWAAGSGLALIVFAIGWLLSLRLSGLIMLCLLVVAILSWSVPVWTSSILGFVAIPLASAGLFTCALRRSVSSKDTIDRKLTGETTSPGLPYVDPYALTATHKPNEINIPVQATDVRPHAEEHRNTSVSPNVNVGESLTSDAADKNTSEKSKTNSQQSGPQDDQPERGSGPANPWIGFFALMLVGALGTLVASQSRVASADDNADSSNRPTPVMIPVRKDGEMVGDRVYVPKSLIDLLFRPKTIEEQLVRLDFQSADYDLRLSSSGMRDVGDAVTIDAIWRVEIDSGPQLVRIPIDPATIDRMEIVVDTVPNEIRPEPDGKSVLVRLPKAGVNVIRATLTPDIESTLAGTGRIDIPIPSVANSTITITPDTVLDQVNLPQCLGQVNRSDSGTRITASLGPVDRLEIVWQRRGVVADNAKVALKRRWWVTAGESVVCREMELEVGTGIRSGVLLELNSDIPSMPQLTTRDWAFASSEPQEATRNRIRVISTIDSPGPIRLLWSDPISNLAESNILLPNVRPADHLGAIETLLAMDLPHDWKVASITTDPIVERPNISDTATSQPSVDENVFVPIEPSEFASNWKGYRGVIDFARKHVAAEAISLRLQPPVVGIWTADVVHQVVVMSNHLRIDYTVTVAAAANAERPLSISFPSDLRIEDLQVNGQSMPAVLTSIKKPIASPANIADKPANEAITGDASALRELLLPRLQPNAMSEIRLWGTIALPADKRFVIPRLRIRGLDVVNDRYVMSRIDGLRVRELKEPSSVTVGDMIVEYDLMSGTVPLRSWRFTDNVSGNSIATASGLTSPSADLQDGKLNYSPWDGGRFRVTEVNDRFAATTLTTLRWNDGVWTMNVVVEMENFAGLTDFLTFKIPSRWIDGLDVQPSVKWSSQPSTDGESHLVRVLPVTSAVDRIVTNSQSTENSGRNLRLSISSRLENAGDGGVAVPQVTLLGGGSRKNYFAVPKRLTTSPIIWQVQNARPENIDGRIAEMAPSQETHTIYETIGDLFSATLQPAPISDDSARCPLVDIALFPHGRSSHKGIGIMRVLLLPGNREELLFHVPSGTRILGAWSAEMPLGFDRLSETRTAERSEQLLDGSIIRIPLALSRLADQLVVLYQFDLTTDTQEILLPKLIDLPVDVTWVCRFQPQQHTTAEALASGTFSQFSDSIRSWVLEGGSKQTGATGDAALDRLRAQYEEEWVTAATNLLTASIDSAAERAATEKREWLRPWLARLIDLGWRPQFDQSSTNQPLVNSQQNLEADQRFAPELTSEQAKATLNTWAPKFFQRVFGTEATGQSLVGLQAGGSWMNPPAGWRASSVVRVEDPQRQPLATLPLSSIAVNQQDGWSIAKVDWILIARLSGLLLLMMGVWWIAVKFAKAPSVWLMALGIASIGIAPLPVCIAILLLSVLGPLVPSTKLA